MEADSRRAKNPAIRIADLYIRFHGTAKGGILLQMPSEAG